jgi:mono/diheme cytochrome c family protein
MKLSQRHLTARRTLLWSGALSVFAVAACEPAETKNDAGPSASASASAAVAAISWSKFDVGQVPTLDAAMEAKGKKVFDDNCSSCHGDEGDAKGPCAPFLAPHPRDFTSGTYRFKTTAGGAMPTDSDLFRTVSLGLNATAMPPWRYLLSTEDRWAAVAYIKTFSPKFAKEEARRKAKNKKVKLVELGSPPANIGKAHIDRGKLVFVKAECAKCHGPAGYGDGTSSNELKDSAGVLISPRNFHRAGDFKRGHALAEIALTVHTGNNGTPMPSYTDAFSKEQVWDLAAYILSLADKGMAGGGTPASATQGENLGKPDVVVKLVERKWKYIPNLIRVKQGQLVRVDFQPTDNGLGVGHGFSVDGYDKVAFINGAMVQRPKSVTFRADKAGKFTFYCATQCSTGSLHPKMNGTFIVEAASK